MDHIAKFPEKYMDHINQLVLKTHSKHHYSLARLGVFQTHTSNDKRLGQETFYRSDNKERMELSCYLVNNSFYT